MLKLNSDIATFDFAVQCSVKIAKIAGFDFTEAGTRFTHGKHDIDDESQSVFRLYTNRNDILCFECIVNDFHCFDCEILE